MQTWPHPRRRITALAIAAMLSLSIATAFAASPVPSPNAQIPGPPSTIYGSINDAAGPVASGQKVQGLINGKVCSDKGKTEYTGDGKAKITVYYLEVVSASQTPGCGTTGAEVTIKIGDRTAPQKAKWDAGPVHVDIMFGDVTPLPIPTFTPTNVPTPVSIGTRTPVATIPKGSPGAGSPVSSLGGVVGTTATANASKASDPGGGGFPLWGIVLIVVGGLALLSGGAGYVMARNRGGDAADGDDGPPPPADGGSAAP